MSVEKSQNPIRVLYYLIIYLSIYVIYTLSYTSSVPVNVQIRDEKRQIARYQRAHLHAMHRACLSQRPAFAEQFVSRARQARLTRLRRQLGRYSLLPLYVTYTMLVSVSVYSILFILAAARSVGDSESDCVSILR